MAEGKIVESPAKLARREGDASVGIAKSVDADKEETTKGKGMVETKGKGKGKKGEKGKNGKGPGQSHNLVLVKVQHEYDEVYSYTFLCEDSEPIMYKAGQWGHLVAPGAESGQGRVVHHMSFASRCEDQHYIFTMDLSSKSMYKQLFAAAEPGAKTVIFKIKGEFVIDPVEQKEIVFIAGGIGITPMRAMITDIVARELPVSCSLIHIARTAHLYQAELERHAIIKQVRTNRLGASEALASSVQEKPQAWYFVCGSQRFLDGMVKSLQDLGVSSEQIRTENFK